MTPVGTHGQGCLTDEEYGAIALAMHHNRDAVDAALTDDVTVFNSYNNRPWFLVTSTAAVSGAQTLTEWTAGTSWNGFSVFSNSTAGVTISAATEIATAKFTAGAFRTGWWNIGGYCSYQPTGAVTNNTRRLMSIQLSHQVQLDNIYDTIVQTSFESNTGTDSMTANDIFYLDNQYLYTVTMGFSHRNSGSTVQVNTGAKIWAVYLGSGVDI
jgi:hypothetical protein